MGGPHSFTNVSANHSHEHAFLYANSQVELSNVHISNLLHPKGSSRIMNPLYDSQNADNMATAIIQSSSSITASNVTIANSAHISDTNTIIITRVLMSNVLSSELVTWLQKNLTVNDACLSETITPSISIFG